MLLLTPALLAMVAACSAFGQTRSVKAFASGALPVSGPATAASLGDRRGTVWHRDLRFFGIYRSIPGWMPLAF